MVEVQLDGCSLTPEALAAIAGGARVTVSLAAVEHMQASATWFRDNGAADVLSAKWTWLVGQTPPEDPADQVRMFVLGHCAGVGEPLSTPLVRAMMAGRANVLATGLTGARPEVMLALVAMLNRKPKHLHKKRPDKE